MNRTIRIFGLDPGLRHTGWGVVEAEGSRLIWCGHGRVSTAASAPISERLQQIFSGVAEAVQTYAPHRAAVETVFVHRNMASALKLGQARGAALVALAAGGMGVEEFSPREVKKGLTGTGSADKQQIIYMVRSLLPKAGMLSEDAADALAVAITGLHHWQSRKMNIS